MWAPTSYVQDCFIRSGVRPDLVHVVPYGVNVSLFRPGLEPYQLATTKQFKILFLGGTIRRKGFDVLLAAYGRAFTAADDVCLVVKDVGVGLFYQNRTSEREIAAFQARPNAPAIEYLTSDLSDRDVASLYAACNCLALPYRGEGFGMPIAEAMACGLPVLVTITARPGTGATHRTPILSQPEKYVSPRKKLEPRRQSTTPGWPSRTWKRWSTCCAAFMTGRKSD